MYLPHRTGFGPLSTTGLSRYLSLMYDEPFDVCRTSSKNHLKRLEHAKLADFTVPGEIRAGHL